MWKKNPTYEDLLYTLAFMLALGVRLINLGAAPLSDFEAGWALQALDLARGNLAAPGPQPGYLALTSVLFSLLGESNALARLWPALAGSLLVLAPFAFRKKLGRKASLILAFGLALDPGLAASSRLADGPMMAVGFGVLALALAYARKPAWSGILAGLALLSGPSVWIGLLGLGLAWGVARLVGFPLETSLSEIDESTAAPAGSSAGFLRSWAIFTLSTILLIGSLFFSFPAGLGAWASSLSAFLGAWVVPSGFPASRLLVALAAYQPLALIFAVAALLHRQTRSRSVAWGLGLWALAALVVALAFPGRQAGDLAWVLVPLWTLAALALSAYLAGELKNSMVLGQAAALFVLLALAWLTLAGLHLTIAEALRLRWLIVLGILVLGILTTAFVGLGWSWEISRNGTALGLVAALGFYGVATMMGVVQVRSNSPAELWSPPPGPGQAELLVDTLRDLALSHTGDENFLDVVTLVDSPALRWAVRDFSDVRFADFIGEDDFPSVILAASGSETEAWSAAYRGQDFSWWLYPGWDGVLPENWVDWLVFRKAPVQTEYVLLWARSDLFPDELVTVDEAVEQPEEESDGVK